MSDSLHGKVALVTGAARGLGLEAAKALAREGATVLLNGRSQEALDRAAAQIEEAGGKAKPTPFDVTDEAAVTGGIADLASAHGRLDVLVNNVGARFDQTWIVTPFEIPSPVASRYLPVRRLLSRPEFPAENSESKIPVPPKDIRQAAFWRLRPHQRR
jgi:NAD(P)-dependent dehydrogenase (short-subunit alcohol dehydrogenase family)